MKISALILSAFLTLLLCVGGCISAQAQKQINQINDDLAVAKKQISSGADLRIANANAIQALKDEVGTESPLWHPFDSGNLETKKLRTTGEILLLPSIILLIGGLALIWSGYFTIIGRVAWRAGAVGIGSAVLLMFLAPFGFAAAIIAGITGFVFLGWWLIHHFSISSIKTKLAAATVSASAKF